MGERYPAIRYSSDMGHHFSDGVWTIGCNSWTEFQDRIKKFKKCNYLWRGQRCDQPLRPSIFRESAPDERTLAEHLSRFKRNIQGGDALDQFLNRAKTEGMTEFQEALSEYYGMILIDPKSVENDPQREKYERDFRDVLYWAIGQHHDLKTPLLDWTSDPYTALFFALCERNKEDSRRVVFGLAEKSRLFLRKSGSQKQRYIELLNKLNFVYKILASSDTPSPIKGLIGPMFARINAQGGIFTRLLLNEAVEDRVRKFYPHVKEEGDVVFLIKMLIPNGLREEFLQKLEKLDKPKTYKTMFPDLAGAVRHCNLKLELSS